MERQVFKDGLDKSKLHFVDVNGLRTRYYEDGTGEPLVLLSGGGMGASSYSLDGWSLNLPELAKHFHVFALDRLGQGHTDPPPNSNDYTFEAGYQHTVDWMKTLGLSQVHIAGHSRGGLLVARIALHNPELVKKLIIVDSGTLAPGTPVFPVLDYPNWDVNWFYDWLRPHEGPADKYSVRIEPDAQAYFKEQVTDDYVARLLEFAKLPKFQEANRLMPQVNKAVMMPSLYKARQETYRRIDETGFSMETLVIWGLNDRSAPLPLGIATFERIGMHTERTEMHILKGAGHNSYRDQPEGFNRAIRSFCLS